MSLAKQAAEKSSRSEEIKKGGRKGALIGAGLGAGLAGLGAGIGQHASRKMGLGDAYTKGAIGLGTGLGALYGAYRGKGHGEIAAANRALAKDKGQRKAAAMISAKDYAKMAVPGLLIGGGVMGTARYLGKRKGREMAARGEEMPRGGFKAHAGEYLIPGYASGKRVGYAEAKDQKRK